MGAKTLTAMLLSFFMLTCKAPTEMDLNINPETTGNLSGTIVWDRDGDGIHNTTYAEVCLDRDGYQFKEENCGYYLETNSDGIFGFYGVPVGVHQIEIRKY